LIINSEPELNRSRFIDIQTMTMIGLVYLINALKVKY